MRTHKINFDLILTELQDGFSYGTDALLLSAFVRSHPKKRAVDLGSGSGVLSLLLQKRNAFSQIVCVDLLPEYAQPDGLIFQNAKANGLEQSICPLLKNVTELATCDVGGEVDTVFSNPPYFTVEQGRRSAQAVRNTARHATHADITDFCEAAGRLLCHGGSFYVVYTPKRLTDLFFSMRTHKIEPKRCVLVCQRPEKEPFAVLVQGKKGAKPGMRTQVLTLYTATGEPTPSYVKIQQRGVWEDATDTDF